MENLINTKEAAAILGVSPETVKSWRDRKIFGVPFFTADEKHGDTWYYYRERVEQLKSVYHKGVLQNIYKLAILNPDPASCDFQKSNTAGYMPSVEDFCSTESISAGENSISASFQKSNTAGYMPSVEDFCSTESISAGENSISASFQKSNTAGYMPFAKDFYPLETVAMMLKLDKRTISRWREKKIFVEDYQSHVGIYFYSEDRVKEMKVFCQKEKAGQVISTVFEKLLPSDETPSKVPERRNVQIYPSKVRVELNDKQTRTIFNLSEESTEYLLNGNPLEIVEKRNHKKFGDIVTSYRIINADGYDNRRPLDQFDRAVLSACNSELLAGNHYTTIPIIYRAITGKVNKGSDAKPTKEQRAAILDSIQLLMSRIFISNPSDARNLLKYDDGSATEIKSALLPAWRVENTTVNGKGADTIIFFDKPCPLLAMTQAKRQILTYDAHLLDVPRQQNTIMNIKLKNYSMIRVQEIIAHNKQMRPIITFNEVFEKCRLENAHPEMKRRAREFMLTFSEYLKHESVIKNFKLTKNSNIVHSIEFSYLKSKK